LAGSEKPQDEAPDGVESLNSWSQSKAILSREGARGICCGANIAHATKAMPDSSLAFQVKALNKFFKLLLFRSAAVEVSK